MKTIVFLETQKSGSSREAIKAAEKLGYFTVLFTENKTALAKRQEYPDVHLMQLCNLSSMEELRTGINLLLSRCLQVCAILSFVDPHCYTACKLADEYNLNSFSTEAIGIMTNKIKSREVLANSPFVPYYTILADASIKSLTEIKKHLPLVVKSPNSTGSKDVLKATTYKEFVRHKNKLFSKYPDEVILVEEYLDGPQYLVEVLTYDKKVDIVAVLQQEITFDKRFIVTGYNLIINESQAFFNGLREAVEEIITLHGMTSGPCHLEMRYVKGIWKLIEINPRISGAGMNHFIQIGLGINLVKETLLLAQGIKPDTTPKHYNYTFSQYVTVSQSGILEKVTGRNRAKECPGVKYVFVKPRKGSTLIPPVSMGNRYAYVIAIGNSEKEARDNAKYAASQIKFWLKTTEGVDKNVLPPASTDPPLPIQNKLEDYREYLKEQGKAKSTIKTYLSYINNYFSWCDASKDNNSYSTQQNMLYDFFQYLNKIKGNKQRTIRQKLNTIKNYLMYLMDSKNISQIGEYILNIDNLLHEINTTKINV